MKTIKLKIVTPERIVLEENVDSVVIPTIEGEITVLPGHVSLISALRSGDIVAKVGEEIIPMAVAGGFIEIKHPPAGGPGGTDVAILADFAEHVFEISDEVVTKAKARADELKKQIQETITHGFSNIIYLRTRNSNSFRLWVSL